MLVQTRWGGRLLLAALLAMSGCIAPDRTASGRAAGNVMKAPVPPAEGTVATGRWRNLFVERGHLEAKVTAKIQKAWDKLLDLDGVLYQPEEPRSR